MTITWQYVRWISFNIFALVITSIPWNLCMDKELKITIKICMQKTPQRTS